MTIYELPHCGSYGEWELNVNFILNATFQIVIHVERLAVIPSFENIISDHLKKTLEFRIFSLKYVLIYCTLCIIYKHFYIILIYHMNKYIMKDF